MTAGEAPIDGDRGLPTTPPVVFKADDFASIFPVWRNLLGSIRRGNLPETLHFFGSDPVNLGWRSFIDCVLERNLKASLGVIGSRAVSADPSYFDLIKELHRSGRFEFFNHGWSHDIHEFKGTPLSFQKDQIRRTQDLILSKTGITLRGFGAPGNNIDRATLQAVEEDPEIEYWFFGDQDCRKSVLRRFADVEKPMGVPNHSEFLASFSPEPDYLVYQVHPKNWTGRMMAEFLRSVDFLQERKASFVLPTELLASLAEPSRS